MTTPDVRLTSPVPCSVDLLSEQEIDHLRNQRSEAARGQERLEAWEGCCVGDLELPSDHLRQNASFLCVSHSIIVSQSKRAVQGYEGFEKLFVQRTAFTINIHGGVISWRLTLASPDSAELKAYALSV